MVFIRTRTKNAGRGKWAFALVALLLIACSSSSSDNPGFMMPESSLLRTFEGKSGLIAYVGADLNIYVINQGGQNKTAVTTDARSARSGPQRQYFTPVWAPGSQRLAYFGTAVDATSRRAVVRTADPNGANMVEVYASSDELPLFVNWTANGEQLGMQTLNMETKEQALYMIPAIADGIPQDQIYASLQNLFWSLEPGGNRIALHIGGDTANQPDSLLGLWSMNGGTEPRKFSSLKLGKFRAPAWSPNGSDLLAPVVNIQGEYVFALLSLQGRIRDELVTLQEGQRIVGHFSPDGNKVSYLPYVGAAGTLSIYNVFTGETISTEENRVLGYFWAPDSQQIAYFNIETYFEDEESTIPIDVLSLYIWDIEKNKTRFLLTFEPTVQFGRVLAEIDTYHSVGTIWSPDTKKVVIASLTNGQPVILVIETAGGLEPRLIDTGFLAFWSWDDDVPMESK